LKEFISKGQAGVGLIVYYSISPSAPLSGISCQVFTLEAGHLAPLFSPLAVYGRIHELPRGSNPNALRFFEGNTMKFGV
jgi:hypothetical protein